MSSPSPAVLESRQVQIETPERVAIGYDLADLGSRFTALVIDSIVLLSTLLVLGLGIPLLVRRLGGVPPALEGWGVGALVLIGFTVVWGYFVYFEGLRDGQTPGKRRLGIRVVHDGGYPLTLRGAAVRNLLRVVDIQPVPSWLMGGVVMLLHPQTKRLGDLAAGTVVVRERAMPMLPEEAAAAAQATGPPRLSDDEFAALAKYLSRREALESEVRARIADRLASGLERHVPWARRTLSADGYLIALGREESGRRTAAGAGGAAGTARAVALVERQRDRWDEYHRLAERAQKRGLERLPEDEVSRFAALYREISADLARARTYGGSPDLIYTLERLVGAGHNVLYRPAQRSWHQLREWITGGFPVLVRLRWRPIALAAAFFYLPALLAFAAIRADPPRAREMLPAGMIARAEEGAQREAAGLGYADVPQIFMPVMATGIIANNVQVTFVAFAGGVLAGLGTVLVLVFNGVFLGAVAALFANYGLSLYLWTFVLPHGIIELAAIAIAGGAGLWLGSALLLPGRLTRREALVRRGREAVSLVAGTTLLLLVAGTIEGFISPAPIPRALKLLFAAVFAGALALYLLSAGRDEAARRRAEAVGERE